MGIYLARIFEQTKGRTRYVIKDIKDYKKFVSAVKPSAINIDYNRGSFYVFRAVFTPGLDLDSDAITASLDSEEYGHLTVQLPISIRLEDE